MIAWLVQSFADLPASTDWLTPLERSRHAALKTDKRRREWLLGRWTAKRLLQAAATMAELEPAPLDAFEIEAGPDGAPQARWLRSAGSRSFSLSLSHSGDSALCALASDRDQVLGADLERIELRAEAFLADYFTPAEIAQVVCASPRVHATLVTALWSAKEAALKAARLGLTVDTRAVECRLAPPSTALASWSPFAVRWDQARLPRAAPSLQGWWRLTHGFVLTLAMAVPVAGDPG
jgi:4'-phosphopantetheinyl transferase